MLKLVQLTDNLLVSAQPNPADLAELAAMGVKTVVCNRPDGEEPGQPSMDVMEEAAKAAGMTFVRYPVNPATFPGPDMASLGKVFDSGDKVFAFCRTGTRCANLWVATRADADRDAAKERATGLGYDLTLASKLG